MVITAADVTEGRVLPRALPGSTVLQIVTTLRGGEAARASVGVARALVQAGARAIVAAEHGAMVDDLRAFGGEWLSLSSATYNPRRLRANAELLDRFIRQERVDIVHARNAGAAWSALIATDRNRARLVTDLPDLPPLRMRLAAFYQGSLSRGDRMIARAAGSAQPMIDRHGIAPDRITVIPHSIDTAVFDPAAVDPARIAALRHAWGIPSGVRVILVPGPLSRAHGQIALVEVARALDRLGFRGIAFVLAGDDRRHPHHARRTAARIRKTGLAPLFRLTGECPDMPAAYAAADVVLLPYRSPPANARAVAEAQTMARPVVVTAVGALPQHVLAPPRMPDDVRTGWVVEPGDPEAMAQALAAVLSLDAPGYRALAARAHEFGRVMFAPEYTAAATLDVYRSLLEAPESGEE